jgi:hypothetical protein
MISKNQMNMATVNQAFAQSNVSNNQSTSLKELDNSSRIILDKCSSTSQPSFPYINMDQGPHVKGQPSVANVTVYDNNGCSINAKVTLDVVYLGYKPTNFLSRPFPIYGYNMNPLSWSNNTDNNSINKTIYRQSAFSKDASFPGFRIVLWDIGKYNVTATVNDNDTTKTSLLVTAEDYSTIHQNALMMLGSASVSLTILLVSISIRRIRNRPIGEILSFILTSASVSAIIGIFIFVTQYFGTFSPIGLVKKPHTGGEWVINFGGDPSNGYASGIQIPTYVFIFGIVGG